MKKNLDLSVIRKRTIQDIMKTKGYSETDATNFYAEIRDWCRYNVVNVKWSNTKSLRKRLAITTYGLKHVCEKELENYVANDWIKAALYEGDYDLKEDYNETSDITLRDIFTNSVNFYFKVKK